MNTPAVQSLVERVNLVLGTLGLDEVADAATAERALADAIAAAERPELWFTLAVLRAKFPSEDELEAFRRAVLLQGSTPTAAAELARLQERVQAGSILPVEVVVDAVTVDVQVSTIANFSLDLQQAALAVTRRWQRAHEFIPVLWTPGMQALRRLDAAAPALVPWRGVHVALPQMFEYPRIAAIFALGRSSRTEVSALGYSYLPVAATEFASDELTGRFARYSGALGEADRVAAVSRATAAEFLGHRRMLRSGGSAGPDILEIPLPEEPKEPTPSELEQARHAVTMRGLPAVLVPGEHGAEQNDLAVLHAAELLWRSGLEFSLALVAQGTWANDAVTRRLAALRSRGRPVQVVDELDPAVYRAAYRCARCVVFPSLHDGFGLPVARSLAAGTPVITSNYGSTAELVAPDGDPRGGLLVDPRDDHAIAEALRRLLTDDVLHRRLVHEATQHRFGTWDEYAAQAWDYLVEGKRPSA